METARYPGYAPERRLICRIGRLLYDRGYVAANDGNISLMVEEGRLLITPAGVSKGRLAPEMLLLCDMEGNVLSGRRSPTSEARLHLEVYRQVSGAAAVVHAHPPVATAFAVCRRGLTEPYLSELVGGLGGVPCTAAFAMPSTEEVPESVRPLLQTGCKSLLVANHGALAWGKDLWEAFDRMETVEHTARIFLSASQIGGPVAITGEEVSRLRGLEGMYLKLWQKGTEEATRPERWQ